MDCIVPGVAKSLTQLSELHLLQQLSYIHSNTTPKPSHTTDVKRNSPRQGSWQFSYRNSLGAIAIPLLK